MRLVHEMNLDLHELSMDNRPWHMTDGGPDPEVILLKLTGHFKKAGLGLKDLNSSRVKGQLPITRRRAVKTEDQLKEEMLARMASDVIQEYRTFKKLHIAHFTWFEYLAAIRTKSEIAKITKLACQQAVKPFQSHIQWISIVDKRVLRIPEFGEYHVSRCLEVQMVLIMQLIETVTDQIYNLSSAAKASSLAEGRREIDEVRASWSKVDQLMKVLSMLDSFVQELYPDATALDMSAEIQKQLDETS